MAFTIEELAARAGMTVRNVRNYQTKGLVPPPALQGRKGVYSDEHLARLELIKEMQASGFNLAAIRKLLEGVPEGSGREALRFEQALLSPWTEERPEIVDAAELAERFGNPEPEILARAEAAGVLRLMDDGRIEVIVPGLVKAGERVLALGIPLEDVVAITEQLVANSNRVATAFVDLFLRNVWRPFEQAGKPAERWPEVRAALEALRPLASEALLGAFQARMAFAVEEAFGTELERRQRDDRSA
jgi:DNA-binding transcriptional MerR regulator